MVRHIKFALLPGVFEEIAFADCKQLDRLFPLNPALTALVNVARQTLASDERH
jgi:hypothetical protein